MAVKPILKMGDPRLLAVAQPVTRDEMPALGSLVDDMLDTMRAHDGAGLAAPQIGVPRRVVIFGIEANPRYPEAVPVPLTVLVNPELEPLGDTRVDGWEGCLSVPGLRGLVPRHARVRYRALGLDGDIIDREVDGFHARVVQHECDHLDGILYPMRMPDMRQFGFEEVLFGPAAESDSSIEAGVTEARD